MDELTRAITVEDEYVHTPYGADDWRENWWLVFFDNTTGIQGVLYNGVQPGLGVGHLLLMVFRGDDLLHLTDRPVIPADADDHAHARTGPVTHEIIDPMRHWKVSADTDDMRLRLDFHAIAPAYDWAWSDVTRSRHYEQSGRVVGEIRFGDTVLTVDGWGQRDRAWGHRADSGFNYAWSSRVIFGEHMVQHASLIRLGQTKYLFGYRIDENGAHLIDHMEVEPTYGYRGGPPVSTLLRLETAAGTTEQTVRLRNVVPRSYATAQKESRQFYTLSEFIDPSGESGLGQLDLWWGAPFEEVSHASVSGNNGRWVEDQWMVRT